MTDIQLILIIIGAALLVVQVLFGLQAAAMLRTGKYNKVTLGFAWLIGSVVCFVAAVLL